MTSSCPSSSLSLETIDTCTHIRIRKKGGSDTYLYVNIMRTDEPTEWLGRRSQMGRVCPSLSIAARHRRRDMQDGGCGYNSRQTCRMGVVATTAGRRGERVVRGTIGARCGMGLWPQQQANMRDGGCGHSSRQTCGMGVVATTAGRRGERVVRGAVGARCGMGLWPQK
jgi:hypothetical protein